jgi:hypothetical protein
VEHAGWLRRYRAEGREGHLRTRRYRPQTNGKAQRFIRTMLGGWAYGAIYRNSAGRNAALAGWIDSSCSKALSRYSRSPLARSLGRSAR